MADEPTLPPTNEALRQVHAQAVADAPDAERDRILAERIAHIESDPLLRALSEITDLGTCGGRGGLQKALDIASAAIEADFQRQKHVGKAGGFCPECGGPNYGGPRQRRGK